MGLFSQQFLADRARSFAMNSRCSRDEDGIPDLEEIETEPPAKESRVREEPLCAVGPKHHRPVEAMKHSVSPYIPRRQYRRAVAMWPYCPQCGGQHLCIVPYDCGTCS